MSTSFQWEGEAWQPSAGVPLSDRGFRHGMSVFETMAIRQGRFVFLAEHLEKIRHTCARFGFREPPVFEVPEALPVMGVGRLVITAGDGGFRDALGGGRVFLFVEAGPPPLPPGSLAMAAMPHSAVWPGLKTGNYWPYIAAYRGAAELRADEIVLIDAANHVISASLANLFAVIDGLLFTPRVGSGARAGVLRDWVIGRADVIVSDFHPEQLREASEIFLTNSGYGIAPISLLENKSLPVPIVGQQLRRDYLAWLENG